MSSWAALTRQSLGDAKEVHRLQSGHARVIQTEEQKEAAKHRLKMDEESRFMNTNLNYILKRFGEEGWHTFQDVWDWEELRPTGYDIPPQYFENYMDENKHIWLHAYHPDHDVIVQVVATRNGSKWTYRCKPGKDYVERFNQFK